MPHDHDAPAPATSSGPATLDRRALLVGTGAVAAGLIGYPIARRLFTARKPVFLARGQRYGRPLAKTIRDGLLAVGFDSARLRGRRVLLKPNLVEPAREAPHLTTHPAVVLAAAEVFRGWGAEVLVGEAPGHVRDTEFALSESGMGAALQSEKIEFVDFNYSQVRSVPNAGRMSSIEQFRFPRELLEVDLLVSMPKLKTHHWVGFTAAMKNLYGTLPGQVYGWPKNVLHYAGIPQTVVDINASVPRTITVVDGILCMEGDGPIMGTPKRMGLLAVGLNPTALDATLARITGFDPRRVPYLALAEGKLGPIADWAITQRGERWQELVDPFAIIDERHLHVMRAGHSPVT
jgi:uncharacterized protein (DUF362 family)